MADLFNELTTATAPAQRAFDREEDGAPIFPKVGSLEQMIRIVNEEVAKRVPDEATMKRMKGSGWRSAPLNGWSAHSAGADCHRSYLFDTPAAVFPVEGVVGQMYEMAFRSAIHTLLDPNVDGTQAFILAKNQGTGRFVPVEVSTRVVTRPDLVTAPITDIVNKPSETFILEDVPLFGVRPVKAQYLEIQFRWADLLNKPELKLDRNGEVISETTVNVQQTGDPALADAIGRLADAFAPSPKAKKTDAAKE